MGGHIKTGVGPKCGYFRDLRGKTVRESSVLGGASLLDTDDREEASCFETEDPYAKAGLRAEVRIIRWRLRWWLGTFDSGGHRPSRSERA
jgi:hypothetical protein